MHVSKERISRSRTLALIAGLVVICAQASSFFSCSFSTAGSTPIVPIAPLPPPSPSLAISVSPTTIVLGQSAVLTWSSSGVTGCAASGAWSGPQPPQGSAREMPATAGTFSYVLNCSTPSGSIAQSATLSVNAMGALGSSHTAVAASRRLSLVRTNLVADVTGTTALTTDPNLGDPWGVVLPEQLPAVVTSRESSTSTSYDGAGVMRSLSGLPRVDLLSGHGGAPFGAAGVVANPSGGFVVSVSGRSAPARLLY